MNGEDDDEADDGKEKAAAAMAVDDSVVEPSESDEVSAKTQAADRVALRLLHEASKKLLTYKTSVGEPTIDKARSDARFQVLLGGNSPDGVNDILHFWSLVEACTAPASERAVVDFVHPDALQEMKEKKKKDKEDDEDAVAEGDDDDEKKKAEAEKPPTRAELRAIIRERFKLGDKSVEKLGEFYHRHRLAIRGIIAAQAASAEAEREFQIAGKEKRVAPQRQIATIARNLRARSAAALHGYHGGRGRKPPVAKKGRRLLESITAFVKTRPKSNLGP